MYEAVICMFALLNYFIMVRNISTIGFNFDFSLSGYLFTTGLLSMVPFRAASVQSCNLYVCATKLYNYAKNPKYNCYDLWLKHVGVSLI